MRHFSDIVGDCSGIVYGSFTPPQTTSPMSILRMLGDKYNMQINNVMMTNSLYTSPRVDMEINMDILDLEKLCDDIKKSLITPLTASIPTFGSRISDVVSDDRPCIKCTLEQKENFIRMIERYCDTCFLGDCDPQDEDDCRKCLERRVRWETE